jgi:hypothetical protein
VRLLALAVLLVQLAATSAPGDRYFGRLNMSALRIRYETMQLKKRFQTHQLLPEQTEHLLLLTEDAFRQWGRNYPKDPWLASTGFAMAQLYAELPGTQARAHAVALFSYVATHFAHSTYGASSRTQLHRGVPVKPDPSWAHAMRATPAPMPPATPAVRPPAATPAAPSSSPTATP